MNPSEALSDSALVVAHPDDEVLWFSAILEQVSSLICCFGDCADLPELGAARRSAMNDYPLGTLTFLDRPEPCSLSLVDWQHPNASEYGMAANAPGHDPAGEARYANSYRALVSDLRRALRGVRHVFTHNPWGEYGHPDHVQVARAVTSLQAELGFGVLHSNYIAPRSMAFAAGFLPNLASAFRLPTNPSLAARIKSVYEKHGAWTWNRAYAPPPEEAFLVQTTTPPTEADQIPLNCLMTT
ncbi:MAG TPA: PIG-L family deacetylase [Polyangiaceae bacterium]